MNEDHSPSSVVAPRKRERSSSQGASQQKKEYLAFSRRVLRCALLDEHVRTSYATTEDYDARVKRFVAVLDFPFVYAPGDCGTVLHSSIYNFATKLSRYDYTTIDPASLRYVLGGIHAANDPGSSILTLAPKPAVPWPTVARRLLIASGYWSRGTTFPSQESDLKRLDSAFDFSTGEFCFYLKQLVQYLFLNDNACDPMIMRRTLKELEHVDKATGLRVVTDVSTLSYLQGRFVAWWEGDAALVEHCKYKAALQSGIDAGKVVILSGESGSGKTVSAIATVQGLTNAVSVYLKSTHLSENATFLANDSFVKIEDRINHLDTNDRNNKVRAALLHSLKADVGKYFEGTAVVIIDEMGECPKTIRALCSIRDRKAFCDALMVSRVILVVVGTGVDAATCSVGSDPTTYTHVRMDSRHVVDKMRQDATLAYMFEAAIMKRLTENARLAACLVVAMLADTRTEIHAIGRVDHSLADGMRDGFVNAIVPAAMQRFKKLNGLSALTVAGALKTFGCAFAAACGDHSQTLNPTVRASLLARYGLLTDNADAVVEASGMRIIDDESTDAPIQNVVCRVPSDQTHRYGTTAAAVEMGIRVCGLSALNVGWDGHEAMMAQLLYLHAWGAACAVGAQIALADVPASDPLRAVKNWIRAAAKTHGAHRALQITLPTAATTWTEARSALEAACTRHCDGSRCTLVVALNKDRAPFADVLVGVVRTTSVEGAATTASTEDMMLLQLKHYATTPLSVVDAWKERHKMGCRMPLAVLASVLASVRCGGAEEAADAQQEHQVLEGLVAATIASLHERFEFDGAHLAAGLAGCTSLSDRFNALAVAVRNGLLTRCTNVQHLCDLFECLGDRSFEARCAALAMQLAPPGSSRTANNPRDATLTKSFEYCFNAEHYKGCYLNHLRDAINGLPAKAVKIAARDTTVVFDELKKRLRSGFVPPPSAPNDPSIHVVVYHPRAAPAWLNDAYVARLSDVPNTVVINATNHCEAFYPTGWEHEATNLQPPRLLNDAMEAVASLRKDVVFAGK